MYLLAAPLLSSPRLAEKGPSKGPFVAAGGRKNAPKSFRDPPLTPLGSLKNEGRGKKASFIKKTENALPCASEAGPSERPLRANGTGPRQPEGGQESHESTLVAENSINPHMKCKIRRTTNVDADAPKGRPEGSQKRTKRTHRAPRAPKMAPLKEKTSAAPSPRRPKKRLNFDYRSGFLIRTAYQPEGATCEFKRFHWPAPCRFLMRKRQR